MKTFIARQPMFNSSIEVVGYEFLFRSGTHNTAEFIDGYEATLDVVKNLIVNFGIDKMASDKRAFINFTADHILNGVPEFFKPESLVIEILEDVEVSQPLLELLKGYKRKGYLIALDDFVVTDDKEELVKIADIIKVDFRLSDFSDIKSMASRFENSKIVLLAEKVETMEEFEFAKKMGFTLFQGYFFERPTMLETDEFKSIPSVYLELVNELNAENISFETIADIIKRDTNLSYTFLKLINSATYYSTHKISSINAALVKLGLDETKKMVYISMLKKLVVKGTPEEIVNKSLKRGRFAEVMATNFNLSHRKGELFLLGMFSLINIILRTHMHAVVEQLPLEEDVKEALLGKENALSEVLDLIILHEMDQMQTLNLTLEKKKISIDRFNTVYYQATTWADNIFTETM